MPKKPESPELTHLPETETKACFDCKYLQIQNELSDEGIAYFRCDKFQTEGNKSPSSFVDLFESDAHNGNDNCINWTANESVESTYQALNTTEKNDIDGTVEVDKESPQYLILAAERREKRLQEVNVEIHSLEDKQAACRREANGYKKPIADARAILDRIIFTDISGFLAIEEEERKANSLPLIDAAEKAERQANAWKSMPVSDLDVTEKDREKLMKYFETCGEVADWISKDWPEKKPGLGGGKTRDRIRDAIEKISNTNAVVKAELAKSNPNEEEQPVKTDTATINKVLSEEFYEGMSVDTFIERVNDMINDSDGRYDFAEDTLYGMFRWSKDNNHVTPRMIHAAGNIFNSVADTYQSLEWEE